MRNRELDFLRGIAVLLVLCRHQLLTHLLYKIGWIGVDLFFVLSGFLVTGLLLREYKQSGKVKGWRFLIRRGFKIYPSFYFFLLVTVLLKIFLHINIQNGVTTHNILTEFFFVQNYFVGIFYHTWSLDVEEHFYLLLIILIFIFIRSGKLANVTFINVSAFTVLLFTLLMRIFWVENIEAVVLKSHLRMDELLFGSLLSYHFTFSKEKLSLFFSQNKKLILLLIVCCLALPFFFDGKSWFMTTFGISFLYLGFGALMMTMIFFPPSEKFLKKFKLIYPYRITSFIGIHSYPIYLWHLMAAYLVGLKFADEKPLTFLIYFIVTIFLGLLFSFAIEKPFLRLREKFYKLK